MAGEHRSGTGHMAGGAGRSPEVHPGCPGSRSRIPVVLITEGRVDVAVLGFHVDFDLGMIRTQMALTAGFGLSGFHDGKPMTGMATGAAAQAAVQIDPAHADVGPGHRVQAYRPWFS